MKKGIFLIVLLVTLALGSFISIKYYSYVFAKTVVGKVINIERVNQSGALISQGGVVPTEQLFSFAIAVKDSEGNIHTASSEDRQWAVVQKDQCVECKFFPYPFWEFDKAGTYFGARLIKLSECK